MRHVLLFLFSLLAFPLAAMTATQRYAVTIDMGRASLTGVMVMHRDADEVRGSMVNEFGVSAIDFIYDGGWDRVRLCHVVPFMDKWYIRRVLRRDLRFCLYVLYDKVYGRRHAYTVKRDGDAVSITNPRYGITYAFAPLNTEETNAVEG